MVRNNSFSVFAGQITGVFGLSARAAPRRQDRRRRDEARFLSRRPGAARRQAGALPRAAAGGERRHRLCDRGPQARGLLRDHVGRGKHLSSACWPPKSRRRIVSIAARCGRSPTTGSSGSTSAPSTTMRRSSNCPAATSRRSSIAKALVQKPEAHHLRRADARRRCRRDRRDPPTDQPARRRGHRGRGDLVLPAGNPASLRPHPGVAAGPHRRGILARTKRPRRRSCTRRSISTDGARCRGGGESRLDSLPYCRNRRSRPRMASGSTAASNCWSRIRRSTTTARIAATC